MIKILLLLLWCPVIILAFNYWDYKVTVHGGKPDYFLYWFNRGVASFAHSTLCLFILEPAVTNYGDLSSWQLLMVWAPFLGFQMGSFWIVYEIVRNIWTKEDLLYYDHQEKDSGNIDRFFAWTGSEFHTFAKLIVLLLTVLCGILIWTKY